MSKNIRIPIMTGLLFASLSALLLWRGFSSSQEPTFEGRPLTSWLENHVRTGVENPPYGSPGWEKADEAIRQIGTNGIPTLLKMIRAKDSPTFIVSLRNTARRIGIPAKPYRHAEKRQREAVYAFEILGDTAVAAVPNLIRIYEQNISTSSQKSAAQSLGYIGVSARAAIPALLRNFTHTNQNVRLHTVYAVMKIKGPPEVVVPALTSALKDPNGDIQSCALSGLMSCHGDARSAVPEILKMLQNPGIVDSRSITQRVATALWFIAPKMVGKPLVVEDMTPMISDGVTTQALKIMYKGKRHTLIKPNLSIPAVAQYWGMDPRPRLTLYRGDDGTDFADRLLGHFEVLNFPASDTPYVQTLCVVVNGQILLCARDSLREEFLEIRRVETEEAK